MREQLKALRPAIPTIVDVRHTSSQELFQNRTLRPILKLQNDLLLALFRHSIEKRKNVYFQLNAPKRHAYIEAQLRKDLKLKELLLGTIIGQFTLEEYDSFRADESELRKRMTNLIIQRLQSQAEQLEKST